MAETGWDRALDAILIDCLAVAPGEDVLVVTDPVKRTIAEAIVWRARALDAEAALIEMTERETHGTEPPPHVAGAMLACRVLIAPTSKSISHTEARRAACEAGARAATMPDITEEMLLRTMAADYGAVKERSTLVAHVLTDGSQVRITSQEGTDVLLSIEDRAGIADDGDLRARGAFGNLPAGEGFVAPVEGTAHGRIVFDGSVWPVGLLSEPLSVFVEDGYAVSFAGADAARFEAALKPYGREAFAVAELGIGTNEAAILSGNVLEDEKILGTVHIAFGDNHTFGGRIRVSSHQDGIMLRPRLEVDGTVLVEGGRLIV